MNSLCSIWGQRQSTGEFFGFHCNQLFTTQGLLHKYNDIWQIDEKDEDNWVKSRPDSLLKAYDSQLRIIAFYFLDYVFLCSPTLLSFFLRNYLGLVYMITQVHFWYFLLVHCHDEPISFCLFRAYQGCWLLALDDSSILAFLGLLSLFRHNNNY